MSKAKSMLIPRKWLLTLIILTIVALPMMAANNDAKTASESAANATSAAATASPNPDPSPNPSPSPSPALIYLRRPAMPMSQPCSVCS